MMEFTLKVDGMHCGSCVRRVSQALAATPGVVVKEVGVGTARLSSAEGPRLWILPSPLSLRPATPRIWNHKPKIWIAAPDRIDKWPRRFKKR